MFTLISHETKQIVTELLAKKDPTVRELRNALSDLLADEDVYQLRLCRSAMTLSEERSAQGLIELMSDHSEAVVVASSIAASLGLTRSTVVNAIRKMESSGLISTRSMGMKGTHIIVHNPLWKTLVSGRRPA